MQSKDVVKTAIGHSKYDDQRAERALLKEKRKKAAKHDKNFSETKDKEFIEFCKATELRKKELKRKISL